ncbi:universal stress protein [Arthrobacter sp. CAN_A1]|uniref:universal stress protein n=1 Tax=Arthrobacter sp. CAN_A1 TaxID=2787717 RepID=UPI0018CABFAA
MTDTLTLLLAPDRPIIVAFRDRATGPALLRWAVQRSLITGQHVTVLHAIPDQSLVLPVEAGGTPYGTLIAAARLILDDESRLVCAEFPGAHVTANVHSGDIVDALVSLSEDASLLVVGADRVDGHTGEYLGSVGQQAALGSAAPVVVLPREPRSGNATVVVGVDGSLESEAALRVAAAEASRSGGQLTVVTSANATDAPGGPAEHSTSSALEDIRGQYPQVTIARQIDDQRTPVQSLLFHAADADLLVIGRHGRGARPGILLGSVTHTLLLDPQCPTLVVTRRSPQESSALTVRA